MKRLLLALSAASLVIIPTCALAAESDSAAIKAVYAKLSDAMRAKNVKAIAALGTPDFTVKEKNGTVHNAKESMAMMEQEFRTTKKINDLRMTLRSIKSDGRKATTTVDYVIASVIVQGGKPHDFKLSSTSRDTLVKTPQGWKFKSVETLSETMTMDGQPMAPPPPKKAHPSTKPKRAG